MPDREPHRLDYETQEDGKPLGRTADRWIFSLGCAFLAGGLGGSLDPGGLGAGPLLMGLGGLLIGLVLPLRFRPGD